MFSPIAVAAKMRIEVAIDMFASEPPWVNGNRNATTNAAEGDDLPMPLRDTAEPGEEPRPGQGERDAGDEHRNRTKTVPSSWPSAYALPNSAKASTRMTTSSSTHPGSTLKSGSLAGVGGSSQLPTSRAIAPTSDTYAPGSALMRPGACTGSGSGRAPCMPCS